MSHFSNPGTYSMKLETFFFSAGLFQFKNKSIGFSLIKNININEKHSWYIVTIIVIILKIKIKFISVFQDQFSTFFHNPLGQVYTLPGPGKHPSICKN